MAEIAGLKLIVPSSVAGSGVSVSASGKVTFTAATSVSVNGCFDSTYDNYLVVVRQSSDAIVLNRLRASGSDASGSNYARQRMDADGATVAAQRITSQAQATAYDARANTTSGAHIYVYGPALAQPTAMRSVTVNAESGALLRDYACTHSLSTSYDGMTFFSSDSSAMTGALTIYGLSQ